MQNDPQTIQRHWEMARELAMILSSVLFISLVVTWIILYFVRLMDIPNQRSSHILATPKCGGVGIVTSFTFGILISGIFMLPDRQSLGGNALLVGLFLIAGISLIDDFGSLSPELRLGIQLMAGTLFLLQGSDIFCYEDSWLYKAFLFPTALFWMVGMSNLFNFMDGIDGLAAGEGVIVALFFSLIQFLQGQTDLAIFGIVLATGCIGFLAFNFPPAKVFMGDVGSVSIGFLLAALAILGFTHDASINSLLIMPLLAANFIFDGALTMSRRAKRGENLLKPHREHLYQRFTDSGFSQRTVTMTNYGLAICQGVIVLQCWECVWAAVLMIGLLQIGYWLLVNRLEVRWKRATVR